MTTSSSPSRLPLSDDISDSPLWLLRMIARGGEGFVEVRFGEREFNKQRFLPAPDVERDPLAVYTWMQALADRGNDVAVGMGVRRTKRGTADACARLGVLFVDVDGGSVEPLLRIPHPPNLVVESHGTADHLHGFWALRDPVDVTDASQRAHVLRVLRGLRRAVEGDPACVDVARCMRMPGTLHYGRTYPDGGPRMCTPIIFRP